MEFATRKFICLDAHDAASYIKIYNGIVPEGFSKTSDVGRRRLFIRRGRVRGWRCRRRHSLRVSCSVPSRFDHIGPRSEPAAGTTYIRVYYIEMWRHFLREGGRNNLIIVSHRCGVGGGSPPLNRVEWIRASLLFLSSSSAASSSRHHPPLASPPL